VLFCGAVTFLRSSFSLSEPVQALTRGGTVGWLAASFGPLSSQPAPSSQQMSREYHEVESRRLAPLRSACACLLLLHEQGIDGRFWGLTRQKGFWNLAKSNHCYTEQYIASSKILSKSPSPVSRWSSPPTGAKKKHADLKAAPRDWGPSAPSSAPFVNRLWAIGALRSIETHGRQSRSVRSIH
jgi:hypothetical protein